MICWLINRFGLFEQYLKTFKASRKEQAPKVPLCPYPSFIPNSVGEIKTARNEAVEYAKMKLDKLAKAISSISDHHKVALVKLYSPAHSFLLL